jgi:allophanate hydrolase
MRLPAEKHASLDISAAVAEASEQARSTLHGPVWLALREHDDIMARARCFERLHVDARAKLPLYGLTFGVKDNIDVAGLPTTAGCPAYAYAPRESASAVERLEQAGAICIGKTHLDQFATGLVGTRSPHGPLRNPFNAEFVCGGSSSGSAVAVALGHVAFALGTDTAGSGRIPAGFNNVVGIKPSRGLVSARGVVPACPSLDCVSIFAGNLATAWNVLQVAAWKDPADPYARDLMQRSPFPATVRLGVFDVLEWNGDALAQSHFADVVSKWRALDAKLADVPFAPFAEAGGLLYEGPWIAERDAAFGAFVATHPEECDPSVRSIVQRAAQFSAADAFRGFHRLREIAAQIVPLWRDVDALLVPTAPTHPRVVDVAREPLVANAQLGIYADFVNLLDLAAISVPAGLRNDGLPAGFTLIAPAGSDHALADLAHRYLRAHPNRIGVSKRIAEIGMPPQPLHDNSVWVRVAVAGAHMRDMPLNHELLAEQARFVSTARTAPRYRLHALPGSMPKPGLVREIAGASIGLELWDLPCAGFGRFVARIPPPMAIGSIELESGAWVKGFVCEPIALTEALDITEYGDWRTYINACIETPAAMTSY